MKPLNTWSLGLKISFCFGLALMLLIGSSCSVALKHAPLDKPSQTYSDEIGMKKRAEGLEGKVGWGRFTLFYIPIVPVHIEGDGGQVVMEQIRDALQQIGYRVTEVNSETTPPGPFLKCKVEKFWFNNYTYFFPLVPTWGEIRLTLSLVSPDEKPLWSRGFSGEGSTLNFFNGYSSAANKSMKKILNALVKEFSSEDFYHALTQHK